MELDVISFVIGWRAFGDIRNRSFGQLVSVMKMAGSAGSQRRTQIGATQGKTFYRSSSEKMMGY
jgi:hypothetical protein